MKVDLTKKLYSFDGEVFKQDQTKDGVNSKVDSTLFFWIKTSLNMPKSHDGRFAIEESASKIKLMMKLKSCVDHTDFEIEADEIVLIKDTIKPILPPESMLQVEYLLNGKENPFEPATT